MKQAGVNAQAVQEPYSRFAERVIRGEIRLPTTAQVRRRLQQRDPQLLAPVSTRRSILHATELLLRTGLTTAGLVLALHHEAWVILAALVLVQSVNYFGVTALLHELAHGSVFASAWANRWLGRLLAPLMMMRFTSFRRSHLLHHRYNQTHDDPKAAPDLGDGPIPQMMRKVAAAFRALYDPSPVWLQRMLALAVLFAVTIPVMLFVYEISPFRAIRDRRDWSEVAFLLGAWGGLLWFGGASLVFCVAFLPTLLAMQLVWTVFLTHSHGKTIHPAAYRPEERALLNFNVVNLTLGRFLDRAGWFFPRYHVEHHFFPYLPFHRLAAIETALREEFGEYLLPVANYGGEFLREGAVDAYIRQEKRTIAGRDYYVTPGFDR